MDRPSLRNVILRKLDDGTLPTKAPNKGCTFRLPLSCAGLWEAVRLTRGLDPAL
jgi:hypothetical protein